MKKVNLILIISLFLIKTLQGQEKELKDSIFGIYKYECVLNNIKLELSKNETFKFYCHTRGLSFMWSETEGTYELLGNKLILNSKTDSIKIKKYKNEILKNTKRNKDSIYLRILDNNKIPKNTIPVEYHINDKIVDIQFSDKSGYVRFKKHNRLGVIKIWDHSFDTKRFNDLYIHVDKDHNSFKILLKRTDGFYFTNFKNETLVFENNKLKAGKYQSNSCERHFWKR